MASYQIEWKRSAVKELKKLPKDSIPRIIKVVEKLSTDPYPEGVRKLVGAEFTYRIRVGNYRVIYHIFKEHLTIEIVRVGHPKDIYR